MSQDFDPSVFEEIVLNEANATAMVPVPEGDYDGYIKDYEFRTFPVDNGARTAVVLEVNWTIPDDELSKELGFDEINVKQSVWLDMSKDGKSIDFGTNKNVGLGRLRKGLNMNEPGKAFKFSDLQGAAAKISVTQTPRKDDPTVIYSNVTAVASSGSLI